MKLPLPVFAVPSCSSQSPAAPKIRRCSRSNPSATLPRRMESLRIWTPLSFERSSAFRHFPSIYDGYTVMAIVALGRPVRPGAKRRHNRQVRPHDRSRLDPREILVDESSQRAPENCGTSNRRRCTALAGANSRWLWRNRIPAEWTDVLDTRLLAYNRANRQRRRFKAHVRDENPDPYIPRLKVLSCNNRGSRYAAGRLWRRRCIPTTLPSTRRWD